MEKWDKNDSDYDSISTSTVKKKNDQTNRPMVRLTELRSPALNCLLYSIGSMQNGINVLHQLLVPHLQLYIFFSWFICVGNWAWAVKSKWSDFFSVYLKTFAFSRILANRCKYICRVLVTFLRWYADDVPNVD